MVTLILIHCPSTPPTGIYNQCVAEWYFQPLLNSYLILYYSDILINKNIICICKRFIFLLRVLPSDTLVFLLWIPFTQ
jgi:hypothetical protein